MTNNKIAHGLIILDGWGHSSATEANAIHHAKTPNWAALLEQHPHTLIQTHGNIVGLPDGQMGNSEVGHITLGAGRTVWQNQLRIDRSIEDGSFNNNPILCDVIDCAVRSDTCVHVFGLLSEGGVHSHQNHLFAVLRLAAARGAKKISVHIITDGRDCAPKSALASYEALTKVLQSTQATLCSVIGRFYAMDRDKRWERTQAAHDLWLDGQSEYQATDFYDAIQRAYERGESDEFIQATRIGPVQPMVDGDGVISVNFRSDRVRQITQAINDDDFAGFKRKRKVHLSAYLTMTQYHQDYDYPVLFEPLAIENGLGQWLSKQGKTQLRVAETEKYPHVTFFFNAGVEAPFAGESRCVIQSPKVKTYDLQPEMSLESVTNVLIENIQSQNFDCFIANFANPDMVGHSGDMAATIKAIEACDFAIGRVVEVIKKQGGSLLICADHGNAELMSDPITHQPHTAHTVNPVPVVYVGQESKKLRDKGSLRDISPTLLDMLGVDCPAEMTGQSLLESDL